MVRPRNALLACFPDLTPEEASEALRRAGGDLEAAKREILRAKNNATIGRDGEHGNKQKEPGPAAKKSKKGEAKKQPPAAAAAASGVASLPAPSFESAQDIAAERLPPRSSAPIHNLSDRQYCCVWHVEVLEDGYRPDVARALLAAVARHVNPILRARGWRVKRLLESCSTSWIGLCTGNGRDDADAASVNIQRE